MTWVEQCVAAFHRRRCDTGALRAIVNADSVLSSPECDGDALVLPNDARPRVVNVIFARDVPVIARFGGNGAKRHAF
jgi:hypothetical protein